MVKITCKEVRRGLKKGKMTLISNDFMKRNKDTGECWGCALTALYFYFHRNRRNSEVKHEPVPVLSIMNWARRKYGYYFAQGFMCGFDGRSHEHLEDFIGGDVRNEKRFLDGCKEGERIRKYLL